MQYEAVIFDLDNTLVDTGEYRYNIVERILRELGSKTSRESIDEFWLGSQRDDIITNDFGVSEEAFWEKFRKYDDPIIRRGYTYAYEDSKVINELKAEGCKLGIVTSCPPQIGAMEVEVLGAEDFDSIIYANPLNNIAFKPNPEGINLCLKQLGVDKSKAVYVGDSLIDPLAAKNAEVLGILIDRVNKFSIADVKVRINSLYELMDFLKQGI